MDNAQVAKNHTNLLPQTENFFKKLMDNMEIGVIVADYEAVSYTHLTLPTSDLV